MTLRRKPKRPWPRRLVGETAGLRARFREEHPTIPIDIESGSAYRAWLNAHRRRARPLGLTHDTRRTSSTRTPHKRVSVADNAALRRAYAKEFIPHAPHMRESMPGELSRRYPAHYRAWLRRNGIDPDTGRMTIDGLAIFEQLVAEENTRNRAERDRRRRRAA